MKETLKKILSIQSESYNQWRMFAYIIRTLKSMGVDYGVSEGNIYASKGERQIKPCIVAHMDTVHDIFNGTLSIIEAGSRFTGFNITTMKQVGIGGDDKVGVFIALELLRNHDNMKCVFFRDEETGCNGSSQANLLFFNDCSFVLQADRRGNKDFIDIASGTKMQSKAFKKAVRPYLKDYGYDFEHGMMTDVMQLKENGLSVCAANISCGYYRPHSADEFVDYDDVMNCYNLMNDLCVNLGNTQWHHARERRSYYGGWGHSWDKDNNYKSGYNSWTSDKATKADRTKQYWDEYERIWKASEDEAYQKANKLNEWPKKPNDFIGDGTAFGEYEDSPLDDGVYSYCIGCGSAKYVRYVHTVGDYICKDCEDDFAGVIDKPEFI